MDNKGNPFEMESGKKDSSEQYVFSNESMATAVSTGDITLAQHTMRVFAWMALGLLATFLTALAVYASDLKFIIFTNQAIFYGLIAAELIVVFVLAGRVTKMKEGTAKGLFVGYSILNGLTFSVFFLVYRLESLILVFGMVCIFFTSMALVGFFTKADLSGIGKICMIGVVGLVIFWVLSMFINLTAFERTVCFIGFGIFVALTAYDTQKIKAHYAQFAGTDMLGKAAILSALALYLDFINMFIYLLRLIGNKR